MKKIVSLIIIIALVYACSSSDDGPGQPPVVNEFDRGVLLTNAADNIIIPAFEDLVIKLGALASAKNAFITDASQSNLAALRSAWLAAYKVWQYVEMFNIGKAEELNYAFQMNVYPTTVADVEANVDSGSYDLTHPNNNDAVGFPALDYLLYGVASGDTAILEKYTTDLNADGYKNYLSDLVDQMQSLTQTVLDDWKNSYRDTFVNSTTNTATSALNKLVNDFIFYYEKGLRANKIGIPAGNFSATPLPDKVEAFYNKEVSKELALDALQAVQDFFNGKSYTSSATGGSFRSYLDFLNTIKNGEDLSTLISNQYNEARTRIQGLDDNFYDQINADNVKMTEAYDALQAAVVLMKVDMLQAFGVSVDFVDADGD